jgi:hypothetical protein
MEGRRDNGKEKNREERNNIDKDWKLTLKIYIGKAKNGENQPHGEL